MKCILCKRQYPENSKYFEESIKKFVICKTCFSNSLDKEELKEIIDNLQSSLLRIKYHMPKDVDIKENLDSIKIAREYLIKLKDYRKA